MKSQFRKFLYLDRQRKVLLLTVKKAIWGVLRARKVVGLSLVLTADIISSLYPVEQDNCRHDTLLVLVTLPDPQCQVTGRLQVKVSGDRSPGWWWSPLFVSLLESQRETGNIVIVILYRYYSPPSHSQSLARAGLAPVYHLVGGGQTGSQPSPGARGLYWAEIREKDDNLLWWPPTIVISVQWSHWKSSQSFDSIQAAGSTEWRSISMAIDSSLHTYWATLPCCLSGEQKEILRVEGFESFLVKGLLLWLLQR